jgi:AAA+ superfamily predicted ATPase
VSSKTPDVSLDSAKLPGGASAEVPAWYPPWAQELADMYFSGSVCLFALHGNVHDLVAVSTGGKAEYTSLTGFLSQQLFGSWDIVFSYDLGRGLQLSAGPNPQRTQKMVELVAKYLGGRAAWPRDPDQVLAAMENVIQRNLLEENPSERKRIAFLFEHAQYLLPAGGLSMLARGQASRLVRMVSWAQNPYIKRVNMAFCLVTDKLSELNERLVTNPHVAAIDVPLPDEAARQAFVEYYAERNATQPSENTLPASTIARISSGLNLVNLNVVLSRARHENADVDMHQFRRLKKNMIERQCQGLVTFVEPGHTLDTVVGHEAAKQRLRQDARWIAAGRFDAAPMGYLVCGPVGTGKTFLAECYAGSIGIPCVTLGNFRSKYVGETEGNLEQVLNVLRSLGPVVVIIDEADAALGNRQAEGDSGTSGRVFSMIASQMGNTRYRGKIIWMLLTSRPDLLPIDLKRQGRAEVHIPLFYPQSSEEITKMFRVMAAKNNIEIEDDAVPEVKGQRNLSGADIESVVLNARRLVLADQRESITREDLKSAWESFIPSAQGLEKEMQELVAVLECTDRDFLPDDWRNQIDQPDGRSRLQKRLVSLREVIEM